MELGLKVSATFTFKITENELMMTEEVNISLRSDPLPPIIHVCLVYHLVFIVMVMTEVYIYFRPDDFLHINLVDCYTFPTRVFLKKLFKGVCKDKYTSK